MLRGEGARFASSDEPSTSSPATTSQLSLTAEHPIDLLDAALFGAPELLPIDVYTPSP